VFASIGKAVAEVSKAKTSHTMPYAMVAAKMDFIAGMCFNPARSERLERNAVSQ